MQHEQHRRLGLQLLRHVHEHLDARGVVAKVLHLREGGARVDGGSGVLGGGGRERGGGEEGEEPCGERGDAHGCWKVWLPVYSFLFASAAVPEERIRGDKLYTALLG